MDLLSRIHSSQKSLSKSLRGAMRRPFCPLDLGNNVPFPFQLKLPHSFHHCCYPRTAQIQLESKLQSACSWLQQCSMEEIHQTKTCRMAAEQQTSFQLLAHTLQQNLHRLTSCY